MKAAIKTLLLTFLFVTVGFSQFTVNAEKHENNSGVYWKFTGQLDTAAATYDSLASNIFNLSDFDGQGTYFFLNYLFTNAAGSPNVLIDLYGKVGTTWQQIEQLVDTTTSEAATFTASTLSGKRSYNGDYKLVIEQVGAGRDDTVFEIYFGSPNKDAAVK